MLVDFGLVALGLTGLIFGGDLLVRGAVALARAFGISPMVIGLTVVGFGTSLPELLTSLKAALAGSPGIAVGNVVGSNIANILLILGIAAVVQPIAVQRSVLMRDGPAMLIAALACAAVLVADLLTRGLGLAFLTGLALYLAIAVRASGDGMEDEAPASESGLLASILGLAGGLALTLLGAQFLVTGAISLARTSGVSETVIGLTVVAVGTSLPELATSVIAARKGQSDVALGNILGSNIFNVLGILGMTAVVTPIDVPPAILELDIWLMLGVSAALLVLARTGWRLTRAEGAGLVLAYAAYMGWIWTTL